MPRDPTGPPAPSRPFDVNVVNDPRVSVVTTPKAPLLVGDVQNPAFNPFQVEVRFSLVRGEGSGEAALPPVGNEGQRLVIEHVTVAAWVPRSQGVIAYIKLGEIKHALVLTLQDGWGSPRSLRASQPIKLYSLGGGVGMAMAGIERSSATGTAGFYFTVSGYAVDLP